MKGADGGAVVIDSQAIIPPAAQTTPPTYGQTNVLAHSLNAGARGNIQAGDINMPCCVTAVIAQNPYSFTGGRDARDFLYLTQQDVTRTLVLLFPSLKERAIAAFISPIVLAPTCSMVSNSHPAIGQETPTAVLMITASCTAISYNPAALQKQVRLQEDQFGELSSMHIALVTITQRKGVPILTVYGRAVVKPIVHTGFGNTGK